MVRKIYLDSRFRDSGTNANFQFTLPAPVLHPKCRAYIDSIHIPNAFYTINSLNRYIYVEEVWIDAFGVNPTGNTMTRKRKIELYEGSYDIAGLAMELGRVLRAGSFFPGAAAGISPPTDDYNVVPEYTSGRLIIGMIGTATNAMRIWSSDYLKANKHLWTETVDPNNPWVSQVGTYVENDDCYAALGFDFDATGPVDVAVGFPRIGNIHVSVIPFHTLYLTCEYGLGTNEDGLSARGGNILRSIPVDVASGSMIHDKVENPFDYVELEAGQLRSFSFALRDVYQRVVDLHHPFSFCILLVEEE